MTTIGKIAVLIAVLVALGFVVLVLAVVIKTVIESKRLASEAIAEPPDPEPKQYEFDFHN